MLCTAMGAQWHAANTLGGWHAKGVPFPSCILTKDYDFVLALPGWDCKPGRLFVSRSQPLRARGNSLSYFLYNFAVF